MPAIHGHKGNFGVGVHATSLSDLRQAKVARSAWCRVHDIDVQHNDGAEFDVTSGKAVAESAALGDYDVRVRATLEGTTEGVVPHLLRSLMGAQPTTTTVGTTGKQHVFEIADSVPLNGGRFSYESIMGHSGVAEIGNGVCMELGFSLDQAGHARWPVAILASSPEYLASASSPTLPAGTTLLGQRKTTFTLDGEATHVMRNCKWNLKRALAEDDYDGTSHQRRDASYGEFTPTFEAELTFENADNFRRFWSGKTATAPIAAGSPAATYALNIKTERADVIPGGTAVHTAMVDMPAVKLTGVSKPIKARELIRQRVTGQGIDVGTYAAKVTLINTVASY